MTTRPSDQSPERPVVALPKKTEWPLCARPWGRPDVNGCACVVHKRHLSYDEHVAYMDKQSLVDVDMQGEPTSQVQELFFELMVHGRFNAYDPVRVLRDLRNSRDKWRAVLPVGSEGTMLRNMLNREQLGFFHADTLLILTNKEHRDAWNKITARWQADLVDWLSKTKTQNLLGQWGDPKAGTRVLKVWWD